MNAVQGNQAFRPLFPGVGEAVASRTIFRENENWGDVATRVAKGNTALCGAGEQEFALMRTAIAQGVLLMSGRHLQHGDETQASRPMEVYTNCSTAVSSFILYLLLLSGSGVGRSYDSALHKVDWAANLPIIEVALRQNHPDIIRGYARAHSLGALRVKYRGRPIRVIKVDDSREGWARAVELLEVMTFSGKFRNVVVIFEFSKVRERGALIRGMQNRPASGPGPMMYALRRVGSVRRSGMAPWMSSMFVDHYLAECVVVGGARRAARMATKTWRDADVFDFIELKSKHELWTSNNSVTVDAEFWALVSGEKQGPMAEHAKAVFDAVCKHSYGDGTGEPGFINQDRLNANEAGMAELLQSGNYFGSQRYQVMPGTKKMLADLGRLVLAMNYKYITNPCGEINLATYGAYCVIADIVPFHAQSDDEFLAVAKLAARALIRTNTMDSLYRQEVLRTNRIGVGLTGVFEYAWSRFGLGWRDLVSVTRTKVRELAVKAAEAIGKTDSVSIIAELEREGSAACRAAAFFLTLARVKRAVDAEAAAYSSLLGLVMPHTTTTMKPAGTTSKLFGLTEAAHLPSMREYVRWVQFREDSPLVEELRTSGYPVRKLVSMLDTVIVGFPTRLAICELGMGDALVTAAEATPEEQYQWLSLLEAFWIDGTDELGVPLESSTGGQVSYTLKYDPKVVSLEDFKAALLEWQPRIKCCSVMPHSDEEKILSMYEYLPEEQVSEEAYEKIVRNIQAAGVKEDIGLEHVDCSTGACPIDFRAAA